MKNCPSCGTQYSDDSLQFCLQDGTPLAQAYFEPEQVTRVRTGGQQSDPRFMESQVTKVGSFGSQIQEKPSSNTWKTVLAVGLTAFAMLILFGFIGLAAFVMMKSSGNTNSNDLRSRNSNLTNLFTLNIPSSTQTPSVTPTRVPATPTPAPFKTPDPTPTPLVLARYPATTRLKFTRGAFTTSFSGDVNPGESRSLVLACRYGQTLSANLSGGGCVTFRGGGTSTRFGTSGGDNFLTVSNNCQQVARFSISITVI